ncbi:hypothetical protein GCM10011584_09770 [Nocardioides phosphati]|uniref:Uncharacterized protein n=1 Tax=Nocardioides phosphati TaxID=1867775 RepID=A0ABQ2N9A0_9ACTN|nr:hypothetical protein [Nocardioides phosphati]GGO86732.1 hypothetical protein GCM10011584_09770 [Nocardioides phosphati]
MSSIYSVASAVSLVLASASKADLPVPVRVGFNGERLDLTFATVADVSRWAWFCEAELVTTQDGENPDDVLLGFGADLYDLPLVAMCPMPRIKAAS